MYTEDYDHKGFPFRDFLLKLILIIIFVFLLVWLLPKFMAPLPIVKENNNANSNITKIKGLDALTSQIYQDNMIKMKNAAISYYTDERLPKEVGESKKMTLREMIGERLLYIL